MLLAITSCLSHAGWTELTSYSEAQRQAWAPAVANQIAQNGTSMKFTMNAASQLAGLFIISDATKGGTAGLLWATGLFRLPRTLNPAEVFKVYYVLPFAGH